MSLDGKLCLNNGSSKWLTGIEARTKAHEIRALNDAVLVGIGTVLSDDPELTVRHVKGINPKRIILDSNLRTPPDAKVIGSDGKCVIITRNEGLGIRDDVIKNATIIPLHDLSVKNILSCLAEQGILNLMVEGGARVISSFLKSGLADYVNFFYAPKILGEGRGFDLNMNLNSVNEALSLRDVKSGILSPGQDIFIEGRLSCSPDL